MRAPLAAAACALLLAAGGGPAAAQGPLPPPATGGLAAWEGALRGVGAVKRVLVIAAHPDDEDTELLAWLTRTQGAEAAYLSLNRGEGGQNLVGDELGIGLGLLRSGELLSARELDGARQYFARAFDTGFSKSLDDTWRSWPRDSVLKDVVRVIRAFRPQVVVSVFSGTPRDGHGQHQAAGWAAHEAFRVAGDPAFFPELAREEGLRPHKPVKLYRSTRFDSAATTLALSGAVLDPLEGRTIHQVAMRSRSLHRSQDMGRLQGIGPSTIRLALVAPRARGDAAFWSGVDTTLPGLAPAPRRRVAARVDSLRRLADPLRDPRAAALLGALLPDLQAVPRLEVIDQAGRVRRALLVHTGLLFDARVDRVEASPGDSLTVTLEAWNGGASPVAMRVTLEGEAVGGREVAGVNLTLQPGEHRQQVVRVAVAPDAPASVPYFVRRPLVGGMYDWTGVPADVRGAPFEPPPLVAQAIVAVPGGASAGLTREVTWRGNDQASGEFRRPFRVVPAVALRVEEPLLVRTPSVAGATRVPVTLTLVGEGPRAGVVRLDVPPGWTAPAPQRWRLDRPGVVTRAVFELVPPPGADGRVILRAVAESGRDRFDGALAEVRHPHVRARLLPVPAEVALVVTDLRLAELGPVGYVRGAADRVPEALRAAGVPVVLLDRAALERGDLGAYRTIVIGPRAYETDSALVRANGRLLRWVEAGGTLVVQYQQYAFVEGGFAPHRLTIAVPHDRVTEEDAPVQLMEPADPLMRWPNALGPADWAGWVQERGLYFARDWDLHLEPHLILQDAAGPPLKGGLLTADVGLGRWTYTGLSFFRQLPAGVPGAFRLFANLLADRGAGAAP